MELVRLYGVGGLAGAVNPANLKTHLGVFLMHATADNAANNGKALAELEGMFKVVGRYDWDLTDRRIRYEVLQLGLITTQLGS